MTCTLVDCIMHAGREGRAIFPAACDERAPPAPNTSLVAARVPCRWEMRLAGTGSRTGSGTHKALVGPGIQVLKGPVGPGIREKERSRQVRARMGGTRACTVPVGPGQARLCPVSPKLRCSRLRTFITCSRMTDEKATSQDNTRQLQQKTTRARANKGRSNAWHSSR